ncbi:MAG: carboxypeptidase-like regulatory domain-containing protein [Bacteroidetes bacterium]|nr:carboxypeptidase-like regulatory domain-containing protein [Bacteroidota bacterium]
MKPVLLRQALCAWLLLLFALPLAIQAQESVSGFVISQKDQQPIANASVLIKGSQRGTSTNERGHFSLSADPGDVFIISGVGIQTTETCPHSMVYRPMVFTMPALKIKLMLRISATKSV